MTRRGAYVRAENKTMPKHPDAVFEDCTLVGPDNAFQAGNPGLDGFTRVKFKNCGLISLNISMPEGCPSTGVIYSTIKGKYLHVDLEDSTLIGYKVFGAGGPQFQGFGSMDDNRADGGSILLRDQWQGPRLRSVRSIRAQGIRASGSLAGRRVRQDPAPESPSRETRRSRSKIVFQYSATPELMGAMLANRAKRDGKHAHDESRSATAMTQGSSELRKFGISFWRSCAWAMTGRGPLWAKPRACRRARNGCRQWDRRGTSPNRANRAACVFSEPS